MPNSLVPPRRIGTRSSNQLAHPGNIVKGTPRRTTAEVQQERAEKARAKAAQDEAKQQKVDQAAEFEYLDRVNEGVAGATPLPPFTPKPWPPPRNRQNANPVSVTETSDAEVSDDLGRDLFAPPCSDKSFTDGVSTVQSDEPPPPPPPPKRLKAQTNGKASATQRAKLVGSKAAGKKRQADNDADQEEPPQGSEPKQKKVKVKVRDEIGIAVKKFAENEGQNKYNDMLKRAREEPTQPSGRTTLKAPMLDGASNNKRGRSEIKDRVVKVPKRISPSVSSVPPPNFMVLIACLLPLL